jgi:hypothetical protein
LASPHPIAAVDRDRNHAAAFANHADGSFAPCGESAGGIDHAIDRAAAETTVTEGTAPSRGAKGCSSPPPESIHAAIAISAPMANTTMIVRRRRFARAS